MLKKSFYQLYLDNKKVNLDELQLKQDINEIPRIRSPNRILLRITYLFKQLLKLITVIGIFILSIIGAFAITNDYIRNEIIWLLFY